MDQRFERLEQLQKEMQEQMQEQLEKIQQDMRNEMIESQKSMMAELTQLLKGGNDKGKDPVVNTEEENNDSPLYPPSFTPPHAQTQAEVQPRKSSVTIRPQQFQIGASMPVNFQTGIGSHLGEAPTNPIVPDFDEMMGKEKTKEELPSRLEERCKWLEEKFKAMESSKNYHGIDAKDLSLVPDLVLPHKFKMPEFEKYNETSCLETHITMFCRRMTGHINNDQLLIHCFQDSLAGAASRWYNQLSRAKIGSWRDLAQTFIKQYSHVADMVPDRITLQNMKKKPNESFRQYAQKWREVVVQVQPPLLEKEMSMLFINTLKENKVNNVSTYNKGYSKSITVNPPRKVATNQQGPSRQEFGKRQNIEKPQFTPIPIPYRELYQNLFDAHVVSPCYLKSLQPPYPNWYDTNTQCDYHAGITGHSIENCTAFKRLVEKLISMSVVKFDDSPSGENPLPNHADNGVDMISGNIGRKIKTDIAEVKTPLKWVLKQMIDMGLIIQNLERRPREMRSYCEFHAEKGHNIQECTEFRTMVQNLMNNKELEFYKEIKGLEEGEVYASKEGPTGKAQNHPVVPWNYDCNVTIPGEENLVNASEEGSDVGFHTRSGKYYDPANTKGEPMKGKALAVEQDKTKTARIESQVNKLVIENKAREFLKFLKHSEYSVVEQLHKQSARISVLELLLSSETHHAEEDIIASVTDDMPYIEVDSETIECSFRSLEFVNATFVIEGSKILEPKISKATSMSLQLTMGKGALLGGRLEKCL
ncbi:uncharacterized protein [Gossypium hirsutum]|uniref:Retrotransposon gag domain-containing protein n=1 Tax=Gossypium hirsutum TaxID=3635 RepID=A0ABM2ZT88_GOSHI|nr:uncharacterized protein LOC121215428 [Gossypium hirsutum]